MKKFIPYIASIGTSIIFGFSFLFSKNALDTLDVFELLFFRFLTASLVMTLLIITGVIKIDLRSKSLKPLLLIAAFQPGMYFITETIGLTYTTSSQAGLMIAFIPIVVTVMAAIFLGEKPTLLQLSFMILSIAGVAVTVLQDGITGSGDIRGILFLTGAVICAALFNILSRRASKSFSPFEITYLMMCFGAVFFGGIFFFQGIISGEGVIFTSISLKACASIAYLGVLSSVVAFLLSNYSLSRLKSSQVSIFTNLTTVVSILAGVIIRHESFGVDKFIPSIMIIAGVWGTNYFAGYRPKVKLEEPRNCK